MDLIYNLDTKLYSLAHPTSDSPRALLPLGPETTDQPTSTSHCYASTLLQVAKALQTWREANPDAIAKDIQPYKITVVPERGYAIVFKGAVNPRPDGRFVVEQSDAVDSCAYVRTGKLFNHGERSNFPMIPIVYDPLPVYYLIHTLGEAQSLLHDVYVCALGHTLYDDLWRELRVRPRITGEVVIKDAHLIYV